MNDDLRAIRRQRWLQEQNQSKTSSDETGGGGGGQKTQNNVSEETAMISNTATSASSSNAIIGDCNDKSSSGSKAPSSFIDLTTSSDEEENKNTKKVVNPKKKNRTSSSSITTNNKSDESEYYTNIMNNMNNINELKEKMTPPSKNTPLPTFAVCTYNIWFGPPQGNAHPSKRMEEIASILSMTQPRPIFVGLQEVTMELKDELFPLLQSLGYHMICQNDGGSYVCAIAVLIEPPPDSSSSSTTTASATIDEKTQKMCAQIVDSGFHPYRESIMGRGLVWVHARVENNNDSDDDDDGMYVLFTTTHLESFMRNHPRPGMNYDGASQRASQIVEASNFCHRYQNKWSGGGNGSSSGGSIQAVFLTGDLNWDDERKRSDGIDKPLLSILNQNGEQDSSNNNMQWMDTWLEIYRGQQDGYTYDSKENPMLKGNLRRRFDRILTHVPSTRPSTTTTTTKLGAISIEMIGKDPIDGIEWKKEVQKWFGGQPSGKISYENRPVTPSDHFGLYVVIGDESLRSSTLAVEKKKSTGGRKRNLKK